MEANINPNISLVLLDDIDILFDIDVFTRFKELVSREFANLTIFMMISVPVASKCMQRCMVFRGKQLVESGKISELEKKDKNAHYLNLIREDMVENNKV